jgi:hypothetical protein
MKSSSSSFSLFDAVRWYIFAGAVHELAHVLGFVVSFATTTMKKDAAFLLYPSSSSASSSSVATVLVALAQSALGRKTDLNGFLASDFDDYDLERQRERAVAFSRCFAVVASCLLFFFYSAKKKKRSDVEKSEKDDDGKKKKAKMFAFAATAFDALCTDVFFYGCMASQSSSSSMVYCGNFGIVLLNAAWCSQNGERAYDLLEKMVNVTMMRGAQSGGIVTFEEQSEGKMRGVRSRVVNMKRTDLS